MGSSLSTRTMSSSESSSYGNIGLSREVPSVRRRKDMSEIVKTGLEMFDVSSSRELQDYLAYFTHEMCSAGTHYFIFRTHSDTQSASVNVFRL